MLKITFLTVEEFLKNSLNDPSFLQNTEELAIKFGEDPLTESDIRRMTAAFLEMPKLIVEKDKSWKHSIAEGIAIVKAAVGLNRLDSKALKLETPNGKAIDLDLHEKGFCMAFDILVSNYQDDEDISVKLRSILNFIIDKPKSSMLLFKIAINAVVKSGYAEFIFTADLLEKIEQKFSKPKIIPFYNSDEDFADMTKSIATIYDKYLADINKREGREIVDTYSFLADGGRLLEGENIKAKISQIKSLHAYLSDEVEGEKFFSPISFGVGPVVSMVFIELKGSSKDVTTKIFYDFIDDKISSFINYKIEDGVRVPYVQDPTSRVEVKLSDVKRVFDDKKLLADYLTLLGGLNDAPILIPEIIKSFEFEALQPQEKLKLLDQCHDVLEKVNDFADISDGKDEQDNKNNSKDVKGLAARVAVDVRNKIDELKKDKAPATTPEDPSAALDLIIKQERNNVGI